jgi:hypothetical protein
MGTEIGGAACLQESTGAFRISIDDVTGGFERNARPTDRTGLKAFVTLDRIADQSLEPRCQRDFFISK